MPDFDANTYYGGEYVNAEVTATPLGQDRTGNFDNIYEAIQKVTIPATGININQIAGDTSRTAFEFAQRIEANNKRSEMRLKDWEQGPLKRLGTLLLSASITELTVHDLENIREKDIDKIMQDINKGRATRDDFEFDGGKPVKRKTRFYIDVKGLKEDFNQSKNRTLSGDSVKNTLIPDTENPNAVHKIAVTEEYVFPDWYVDSGVLFDTKCDSKRMVTNKKIRDVQAIQGVIQNFLMLLQVDPSLLEKVDVSKLFEQILKLADIDESQNTKNMEEDNSDMGKFSKMLEESKNALINSPSPNVALQTNPQQPSPIGTGQGLPPVPQQGPTAGPVQSL
jgi:hypothetical protein